MHKYRVFVCDNDDCWIGEVEVGPHGGGTKAAQM